MLTKLLHALQPQVSEIEPPLGIIEFLDDGWMASLGDYGAHSLEGTIF